MKKHQQSYTGRGWRATRGFTLVELLVVIAIIGVLVGITVPAVQMVRTSFTNKSIKFEVQSLAEAVEKYRSANGDYPPDGSSWPQMESHLRKAFPNILNSELALLNPSNSANNGYIRNDYATGVSRVMDPAEALVFFLGGFSKDSQKPFTGKGGPFTKVGNTYTYNASRENAYYEFRSGRLDFEDDTNRGDAANDLLPVYLSYSAKTPYVYFSSKTYSIPVGAAIFFNYHRATPTTDPKAALYGVARPLLAANFSTSGQYDANKTFQVLSPGRDSYYGWQNPPSSGSTILFTAEGQGFNMDPVGINNTAVKFTLPEHSDFLPMRDNVASSLELATFADSVK